MLLPENSTLKNMENKPQFSPETASLVKEVMSRYPEGKQKSALLPVLHLAQAEFDGWLSAPVMDLVAEALSIKPIEVYEVASFYSMYNLKPVGKCLLEVCRTSSCWLRGADEIVAHLEKTLGIKEGETTPDGMFTLKTVECLGSCGTAPMLQCGAQFHENLDIPKVDQLLDTLRREGNRKTYFDPVTITQY
jgi:NADH-quinone oxidoreductase subunit E